MHVQILFPLKLFWLCGIFLVVFFVSFFGGGFVFFSEGGSMFLFLQLFCISETITSSQSFLVYTSPCLCKITLGEYGVGTPSSRVLR